MKKLAAFLVYLLAFAVIIAMGGLFAGYWISNSEENLSYVYVGDVNVSGLTMEQTEELLKSRGWGDRETVPLTVTTFRGQRFSVDPVRSGVATPIWSAIFSPRRRSISTRWISPEPNRPSITPTLTA